MRGEVCIGFASILSLVSIILLIFLHVGTINTSTIPRNISMVKVNMSNYSAAVQAAISPNPVFGLYTNNATAPLQARAGLRQFYEFGLYSYCAYVDEKAGTCGNHTVGQQYTPYDVITADMAINYSIITSPMIVPGNTFRDSKYLGATSQGAYWLILLGTICAVLALITGIAKNNLTFFVSAIFAGIGSLLLLIGASLWTVMIKKTQTINTSVNPLNQQPLHIIVTEGSGLFITWAAFLCLFGSVIPYVISCCTYRG